MMKTALQIVCGALALSVRRLSLCLHQPRPRPQPQPLSTAAPLGRLWVPDFRFWRSVSVMGFTGSESAAVNGSERTPEEGYTAFYLICMSS